MYRKLNNWKSRIRSKIDKGKGKYHINIIIAEEAIYQVIAEHAKAHHRRLETDYVDEQVQRLQSTDMRRIANEALRN